VSSFAERIFLRLFVEKKAFFEDDACNLHYFTLGLKEMLAISPGQGSKFFIE
jgi:hypothetical protein